MKLPQTAVAYRAATDPARRCDACIMYRDRTCTRVAGQIDPGGTCDIFYPADLAPAAAEAYLAGWALTDAPFTGRVEAGCYAAVQVALEHRYDPAVLEVALQLGQLEGVWAVIYRRRARLQAKHERAIAAAWDACTAELDPADVARRFRSAIYLHGESATKDPTKKWWQDIAITAALAWLRGIYHTDGYPALAAALEDAIRSGMAEGEADALALAAARLGRTGFQIGQAFKTAYARLATNHVISQQAADAATRMIDAAAGDTGRRLASLAGDGASEQEMTSGAGDTSGGKSNAVTGGADRTVWAAILAGAVGLWSRAAGWLGLGGAPQGPDTPPGGGGPGDAILLDWINAADDRVCATCQDYSDNGPYTPDQVPGYPHSRCRCSVDLTANTAYTSFLGALLDQFTN